MMTKELSTEEKKMLNTIFIRSGLLFGSFNMVNMQGQGFEFTMIPAINKLYKNDETGRIEALKRHVEFFNCHSSMSGFIYGLTYALEKQKAENCGQIDGSTITNIKTALMGPLAGIGDSLFFNTIRIIAAGIAISLCATGNVLGVPLFILLYGGSNLCLRYLLIHLGYTLGSGFIEKIFNSGILKMVTKAASTMGLIMVGAMVASMVKVNLTLTWQLGDAKVALQPILDSILPGMLSLLLLLTVVKGIKKGYSPTVLVITLLVMCIILAGIGIF